MCRGAEYNVNFLPKMKIEVAVSSKDAGKVVSAIKDASESGKIGDGKIFTLIWRTPCEFGPVRQAPRLFKKWL